MAGERSDLGKIFITPGGDYDATVTYETLTMVKYNNSLYLTLRTVTGVTPSDDRVNYLLMAQGFTATRLESITATDVQGLVTEPGDEMPAQTLINAIADRVANQLVTNSALTDILGDYILKSAIANNLSITEEGKVLDARQGKALNDALASTNEDVATLDSKRTWVHTNYAEFTGQTNVTLPTSIDYKDLYIYIKGNSGYYSLYIPRAVYEAVPNTQSFYLNGWYYSTSQNSYGFVTKNSNSSIKIATLFENGQNVSASAKGIIFYR